MSQENILTMLDSDVPCVMAGNDGRYYVKVQGDGETEIYRFDDIESAIEFVEQNKKDVI